MISCSPSAETKRRQRLGLSFEAKEEQRNKFKMEKRKKWQAESDEQKQIHNEKKRLATEK